MVVRTQSNGRDHFGLLVGATNARRYFPRTMSAVELELDELHIECRLPESFWDGQPEINDPRLCEWLKFKVLKEGRSRSQMELNMVQSGANTFRLQPGSVRKQDVRLTSAA